MKSSMILKSRDLTEHTQVKENFFLKAIFSFIVLICIYLTDSVYFTVNISHKIVLLAFFCSMLLPLYLFKGKGIRNITFSKLYAFLFLTMMVTASMLINDDALRSNVHFILLILSGFIISELLSFERFTNMFTRWMFFFCISSLIIFILTPLLLEFHSRLPVITNSNGLSFIHLWLSDVPIYDSNIRNFGIFWEPGVFQAYINFALLFELFFRKAKVRLHYVAVYFITVISTLSTTGIAVLLIIMAGYVTMHNSKKLITIRSIKVILVILSIAFIIFMYFNINIFIGANNNTVFGKIAEQNGSYTARVNSAVSNLFVAFENPVFGSGIYNSITTSSLMGDKLYRDFSHNSNTFTFWMASFGFITGIIFCWLWFKLSFKICINKTRIRIFIIFAAFILILSSENYVNSIFFNTLIWYSFECVNTKKHEPSLAKI